MIFIMFQRSGTACYRFVRWTDKVYRPVLVMGLCEIRDRATGKIILQCRIQETNGLYTLSQEQYEEQLGVGHQLCMAHSIRTDPASRLHYILNHASAARCNYICKCEEYPGLKYTLTEKMRDTIKKCVFCHMAKGSHRPNCKNCKTIQYQVSHGVLI